MATNSNGQATLAEYLGSRKNHLESVIPKSSYLTADKLVKLTILASNKTPKLRDCGFASVLMALMQCGELGLEPSGTLGHAFLVPFKDQCQLVIGYRGLISLARRSGALRQIEAHVVHEKDQVIIKFGLNPVLEHEPYLDGEPGNPRLAYCVAQLTDGSKHVEVMTMSELLKIRKRSRAPSPSPWDTDFEEMCKKTVARRACKWIPMSSELAKALAYEDEGEVVEAGGDATEVLGLPAGDMQPKITRTEQVKERLSRGRKVITDVKPGETEEAAVEREQAETGPAQDAFAPEVTA